MITTNHAALTGAQIADGLTSLATFFAAADTQMPELLSTAYPDQAPRFQWIVDQPRHVRTIAARLGVDVKEFDRGDGTTSVSSEVGLGTPRAVDSWAGRSLVYTHPLVLRVTSAEDEVTR